MPSRVARVLLVFVVLSSPASADTTSAERRLLDALNLERTIAATRHLSEHVVKNRSGAGAGTILAGSADERLMADHIERELKKLGLAVRQERFPVRHYSYGEVRLTAGGRPVPAISLHGAGGTWGTRDEVPYFRGNEQDGRRVRASLVDVGEGYAADYDRAGDVRGKAVLVRRVAWPTYTILEAAHRGAAALLLYDYPGSRSDTLKQDSMWYHEQLPTVSITKNDALALQQAIARGPLEIVLESRVDGGDGFSQNVIATIAGREAPDEWVVVSAHYDRWFQGAQDNSVGVAVMLELARVFSQGYQPRRSLMFIATGAEEAGVEATESDWLAGSQAFVRAHPEVMRRLAYLFNVDFAGWTAAKGLFNTTADAAPFHRQILADLGLTDRLTIQPNLSSSVDAWNFGSVGGGAVGYVNWQDEGMFSAKGSYAQYYHTQLDVFRPEDYTNLVHDLRVGALGMLRMDQAVTLPISFTEVAAWVEERLMADAAKVRNVSFAEAQAALRQFRSEAERVESRRSTIGTPELAAVLNRWLMRTRKALMPWLAARAGVTALRTSPYATDLAALSVVRANAETGDGAATIEALERINQVRAAARVSPDVYAAQRLYWYSSGDWSAEYEHKPRPVNVDLAGVYRRLKSGGSLVSEMPRLQQLEAEARGRLAEALFIVAGKLAAAAAALQEAPFQPASRPSTR